MRKKPIRPAPVLLALLLCAGMPSARAEDTPASGVSPVTTANQASFNFVNADIESVIKAIGDYTDITFIIDPRVKGTLNLVSEKPLSKTQALQLLSSVLRMQGYAVVNANGYSKVVPEADAKLQGSVIAANGAGGNQVATRVFHLNHEAAANLVPVLRPLISPNNIINANPDNNTLVITDYADNLTRMGKIIAALDGPTNSNLDVVPLRHTIANDIAAMVNKLMEQGTTTPPVVLADSRTNTLIVRAPSEARANLAKSLIAKLDQPTTQPGNVHVVYLKNAEAMKLALTLRAVISADTSSPAPSTPSTTSSNSGSSGSSGGSSPPPAAPSVLPSGGAGGFIQADPATNTLIITASEPVYRNMRSIIDQLDARRAQVYVEALIVEVDASKFAEFGVQWAALGAGGAGGTSFSTNGDNLANQLGAHMTPGAVPPTPSNGLTLGLLSRKIGFGALVHALQSDTKTNILSMPNLITLDNDEAKIMVGENVPFITGQYTTQASAGAAGVNPFQTVERKDIGLTLKIKPQISQGGTVKMAIYQETSAISPIVNSAGLITTKRSIDTNVLVDDGQIIVLGGLIDDNLQDSEDKVPFLGDIPWLGTLFRYHNRTHTKTNLMVFLRPTIIRSNAQSIDLSADRYDFIRNTEIDNQPLPSAQLPDMELPLPPELRDGKLVGGALAQPVMKLSPTLSTPATAE
ncbi:MAG: type II secretion system protein GspD [Gallionella sp.]|nr:type II secretion system protein GspD [Gallionella sp.]